MSKIKLYLSVVENMRNLADSIEEMAQAMADGDNKSEIIEPTTQPEKQIQPTLEEVRAVLARLSKLGKQTEVKALIQKYGADKLTDINADNYISLLSDAKELEVE